MNTQIRAGGVKVIHPRTGIFFWLTWLVSIYLIFPAYFGVRVLTDKSGCETLREAFLISAVGPIDSIIDANLVFRFSSSEDGVLRFTAWLYVLLGLLVILLMSLETFARSQSLIVDHVAGSITFRPGYLCSPRVANLSALVAGPRSATFLEHLFLGWDYVWETGCGLVGLGRNWHNAPELLRMISPSDSSNANGDANDNVDVASC